METNLEVELLLTEIAELLQNTGESNWSAAFARSAEQYLSFPDDTRRQILGSYGGMGSFNDLVLYDKDGLLVDANNRLDSMRSELFRLLTELQ